MTAVETLNVNETNPSSNNFAFNSNWAGNLTIPIQ